ncbi:uncharacterized protein LOC135485421 isoform X2 [Lineus longissimus]|uniref:uncharacterized protein LOC135485421 isoform X2 n=1 Tax=Lineus longissimus TaxID=88925 RepID=UPI00315D01DB
MEINVLPENPIMEQTPLKNCPVVYEIPGGMLYGTRIDLRVRPSEDMKSFSISLQRDIVGNPKAGVAMKVHYDIEKEDEISCIALVGDDFIETPVAPVKREMFEDRFFVLSISTMPLHYKVYVDSIFLAEQQHYMDVQSVLYIRIDGDLLVYCAEVTDNFSSQHLLPVGRRDVEAAPPTKPPRSIPVGSPHAKPKKKDATMDSLPKEYQTMMYELEEQSSRIDEEIKRISQKTVQKTQTKKAKRKVPAPKIEELSDEEPVRKEKKKKGQERGQGQEKDKTRFGKFFQKLKKPRKSFRKDKGQVGQGQASASGQDSDNASELSTDFEAYLMMTDSDVDSRESPTELLYEVEEQERRRKERLREVEVEDVGVTATSVSMAGSAPKDDHSYDSGGVDSSGACSNGDMDYEADINDSMDIPFSSLEEPRDQIIRIRAPAAMPEKTRLRISTQVVNEAGEILSESTEDMEPKGTYAGVHLERCKAGHPESQKCACPCHDKKYHLIHHHVHHHLGQDDKKMKLDGGVEVPPYSSEAPPSYTPLAVDNRVQENMGLLRRRDPTASRWRWWCCQCYSY